MADSRFFTNNGPVSLKKIIELTGAQLHPNKSIAEQDFQIDDVAPLESAKKNELSFFINSKYLDDFKISKAGICLVQEKFASKAPESMITIVHNNPYKAYAIIASFLYGDPVAETKISKNAAIAKTATIGKDCSIGDFVVIEEGVIIGDYSNIDHNSVIKRNVIIGSHTKIASNVTISHTIIGNYVTIHPGAKIGQDGFGFASDHTGHTRVPQLGIVKIGNYVNIGANTTIDRGSSQDTIINDMTQIDNLVQLGHNVTIGTACVIVAQVGIAGSCKVGDFSVLGGQVGVAGHLNIGRSVQVAAQSGVTKNIEDKQIVGGYPAVSIRQWHKQTISLAQLTKIKK